MTRLTVEIVKSTPKAHLVKDSDGRQGWIQRRWLAADSTINQATFEKAVASAEQRQQDRDAARTWRNDSHALAVARETEKAVAVEVVFEAANLERTLRTLAWFPKSMIDGGEGTALVPGWMIAERISRAADEVSRGRHGLGMILETVGGVQMRRFI